LGKQSLKYLDSCGFDIDFRFREWEHKQYSFPDWPHEKRLSDFLICATHLENFVPQFHLEVITHEWLIRRYYHATVEIKVQRGTKHMTTSVGVIPDAFFCFVRSDGVRFPVLFEMVRQFASKKRIKEKILALLAYVRGPYRKLFDMPYVTIAFAVSDNDIVRRDLLLSYCEQVLEETGQKAESIIDLFRVCSLPHGVLDPKQVFISPLWHRPFDFERVGSDDAHERKVYAKPLPLLEVL
jgi:hypothetical protein